MCLCLSEGYKTGVTIGVFQLMLNIVKVAGVKDLHVYMFPLRPSRLVMSVSGPLSFVVKKTKEKAGYYCHYFSPCVKQSLSML